jgi:hypothetical protein
VISRIPQQGSSRSGFTAGAVAFVLLAGWSTAQGAAGFVDRCGNDVRDLTSLDVSQDSLAVKQVDHVSSDTAATTRDYLNARPEDNGINDEKAPILYLTPRVADMLRNVFKTSAQARVEAARGGISSSPLADVVKNKDAPVENDKAVPGINAKEEVLPRFQQQMYRTDI